MLQHVGSSSQLDMLCSQYVVYDMPDMICCVEMLRVPWTVMFIQISERAVIDQFYGPHSIARHGVFASFCQSMSHEKNLQSG